MIREPKLDSPASCNTFPGPDFPGGGQIITPREEMTAAYETGRGSVRVRARWTIERLARGQWQMVVHELPPGTSSRKVLEEIDALTNPQPKPGKKSLTPEQQREKQLMLSMLDTRARRVRPHASGAARVRAARPRRSDENEFINLLLAKTEHGGQRVDELGDGGPGRPAHRQEPARHAVGVDAVPASPRSRGARGSGSTRCSTASTCSKGG